MDQILQTLLMTRSLTVQNLLMADHYILWRSVGHDYKHSFLYHHLTQSDGGTQCNFCMFLVMLRDMHRKQNHFCMFLVMSNLLTQSDGWTMFSACNSVAFYVFLSLCNKHMFLGEHRVVQNLLMTWSLVVSGWS